MVYSEPLGDSWKYHPEYNRIADFLGIDLHRRMNFDVAKKISFLRDYMDRDGKKKDVTRAVESFYSLQKKLGVNTQGDLLLNQMYQFARLDAERVPPPEKHVKPKPKTEESPKIDMSKVIKETVSETIQGLVKHFEPEQYEHTT